MSEKLNLIKKRLLESLDRHFKIAFAIVLISLLAWELSLLVWAGAIWLVIVVIQSLDDFDKPAEPVSSKPEA